MGLASQKFFNAADGCWYEVSNSREWHEEDHPRASDGRFTDGEKSGSSEEKSRKEKALIKEFRDLQKVKYDLLKPSETLSRQAKYSEQGKKAYEEWHQKVRDLDKRIDEVKSKIDEMNKGDDFLSLFQKKKWKSGQEYEGATFEYNGAQIDARKDGDWIVGRYYAPEGKKIKGTVDTWSDFEVKEKDFNSYIKNLIKPETFIDK